VTNSDRSATGQSFRWRSQLATQVFQTHELSLLWLQASTVQQAAPSTLHRAFSRPPSLSIQTANTSLADQKASSAQQDSSSQMESCAKKDSHMHRESCVQVSLHKVFLIDMLLIRGQTCMSLYSLCCLGHVRPQLHIAWLSIAAIHSASQKVIKAHVRPP